MTWRRQATSHYPSQCWPGTMAPYGTVRPQCFNSWREFEKRRLFLFYKRCVYWWPTTTECQDIRQLRYSQVRVHTLTHWGRVTHICVGNLTIIGSDNGLSPGRRQAIIWTNAGILLIGHLRTNFSEILIEIQTFSYKKMHLKMSSGKWRPFCLGLNVLTHWPLEDVALIPGHHKQSGIQDIWYTSHFVRACFVLRTIQFCHKPSGLFFTGNGAPVLVKTKENETNTPTVRIWAKRIAWTKRALIFNYQSKTQIWANLMR